MNPNPCVVVTKDGHRIDPKIRKCPEKKSVIAFLDLLGSSKAILAKDKDLLPRLARIYEIIKEVLKKNNDGLRIKTFSDNIVIIKPTNDRDLYEDVDLMITNCAAIQYLICIDCEYLVRGGITVDTVYYNNHIVWGSALVRAYELESKIAIYPRIIIDPQIKFSIPIDKCILDEDDIFFINYLKDDQIINYMIFKEHQSALENIKSAIKKQSIDDTKIIQKINWAINFHNNGCRLHKVSNVDFQIIK